MNEFVRMVLSNNLTTIVCIITLSVFVLFVVVGLSRIMLLSYKFKRLNTIDKIKKLYPDITLSCKMRYQTDGEPTEDIGGESDEQR